MNIEQKHSVSISLLGKESDKAAAEVIRVLAGGAARGVVDYGEEIFSGLIGDRIREWRKRNFIRSAGKTAEFLQKKGVPLDKASCLKDGEIYRLFEGASRTDEVLVSDLWAGLLANAMDPKSAINFEVQFTNVLEQLHSHDVKILDFMRFHDSRLKDMRSCLPDKFIPYQRSLEEDKEKHEKKKEIYERVRAEATKDIKQKYESLDIDEDLIRNSIENLVRLDLIFLDDKDVDISTSFLTETSWDRDSKIDSSRLVNIIDDIIAHLEYTSNHRLKEQEGELFSYESRENFLELIYDFTGFGERLLEACYLDL